MLKKTHVLIVYIESWQFITILSRNGSKRYKTEARLNPELTGETVHQIARLIAGDETIPVVDLGILSETNDFISEDVDEMFKKDTLLIKISCHRNL